MSELWESVYKSNAVMWGEESCDNAIDVLKLFQKNNTKNVLIPGFGYGRNAKLFYENGISVTGIEISKTAIERARKYFKDDVIIHHGSIINMPFDSNKYESIYCYSTIHLLDLDERLKFIEDCFEQLKPNGLMVFTAISINDKRYGEGKEVGEHTYKSSNGLTLYFYNEQSIKKDFASYNIIDLSQIKEPKQNPDEIHWMVVCRK